MIYPFWFISLELKQKKEISTLITCAVRIASDFSAGMVAQIQKMQQQELDGNPIWSRVEAKLLDAQVLDGIDDASISHITGTMVYNLVSDGRQALQAAHRVLQPAGVIGMTLGSGAEWIDMVRSVLSLLLAPSFPLLYCLVRKYAYSYS